MPEPTAVRDAERASPLLLPTTSQSKRMRSRRVNAIFTALVTWLDVVASAGSITFYSAPRLGGAPTRVFLNQLKNAPGTCMCIECVPAPVRSMSWADLVNTVHWIYPTTIEEQMTVPQNIPPLVVFETPTCKGTNVTIDTSTSDALMEISIDAPVRSFMFDSSVRPTTIYPATCNATVVPQVADVSFAGSVTFHDMAFWSGNTVTLPINSSQICHDVALPPNFSIASMRWSGLPTRSTVHAQAEAQLITFDQHDCQGDRRNYRVLNALPIVIAAPVRSLVLEQDVLLNLIEHKSSTIVHPTLRVDDTPVNVAPFNGSVTFASNGSDLTCKVDAVETCYRLKGLRRESTEAVNVFAHDLPTHGRMFVNGTGVAFYADKACKVPMPKATAVLDHPDTVFDLSSASFLLPRENLPQSFMVWVNHNKSTTSTVIKDACDGDKRQTSLPPLDTNEDATIRKPKDWIWWLVIVLAVGGILLPLIRGARRRQVSTKSNHSSDFTNDQELRNIRVDAAEVQVGGVLDTTDCALVCSGRLQSEVVLVKKLRPAFAAHQESRQAFVREAKLMHRLDHPKITRFLGIFWVPGGDMGLVYEFMRLGSLAMLLDSNRGALTWTAATGVRTRRLPSKLQMATDVAEALMLLHSFDPPVVHGDLSPRNVLLDGRGVAKLWNFSLSASSPPVSTSVDVKAFGVLLAQLDGCYPSASTTEGSEYPLRRVDYAQLHWSASCPSAVSNLARRCCSASHGVGPSALQIYYELRQFASTRDLSRAIPR